MKKIESITQVENIKEGDRLMLASDGEFEVYQVTEMSPSEVIATHTGQDSSIITFHPVHFIFDDWWLP